MADDAMRALSVFTSAAWDIYYRKGAVGLVLATSSYTYLIPAGDIICELHLCKKH